MASTGDGWKIAPLRVGVPRVLVDGPDGAHPRSRDSAVESVDSVVSVVSGPW